MARLTPGAMLAALQGENARRDALRVDYESAPDWFHPKQKQLWNSESAIISIVAGWQGGKTSVLGPWLKREIQRCWPGDYGAFSATFKLLDRKFLPDLKKEFADVADYKASSMQFVFTDDGSYKMWGSKWNGEPTVIQLGYAENPDSLESATMKAVVWDEPGQRLVPEQSFLTVQSRLMVNRGRMVLASRPYESGWFEKLCKKGQDNPSNKLEVINFASWANPMNPPLGDEYWEDLRSSMPLWKFAMLYEGRFEKPAGVIYDTFDYDIDTVTDFEIEKDWKVYPGVDFGNINFAGGAIAEDPVSKTLYVISEYLAGQNRSVKENIQGVKDSKRSNAPGHSFQVGAGGSHQEGGWRDACRAHGLPVEEPPINEVEVQIGCVYAQLAGRNLKVFRSCEGVIEQFQNYSRELDENSEPTEKIARKATFHHLDWIRYIITRLRPPIGIGEITQYKRFGLKKEKPEEDDEPEFKKPVKTERSLQSAMRGQRKFHAKSRTR